jgi:hypothetical protein
MNKSMIAPAFWGAVIGIGATAIVGFSALGWVGAGSAEQMAKQRADSAVVAALVPVCIAQSQTDAVKLTELAAITKPFDRRDFVMSTGWATTVPQGEPNRAVAEACAAELSKAAGA